MEHWLNSSSSKKVFFASLLLFAFSASAFSHLSRDIPLTEDSDLSIASGTTLLIPRCQEEVSFEDYIVQLSSVDVLENMSAAEFFAKCSDPNGVIGLVDEVYSALNNTGNVCGELGAAFTTCQASLSYCEELKQADACIPDEEKLMLQCLRRFGLNSTESHCIGEFQRNAQELEALCGEEFVASEASAAGLAEQSDETQRSNEARQRRRNDKSEDAKQEGKRSENGNDDSGRQNDRPEPARDSRRNGSNEVIITPSPADPSSDNNSSEGGSNPGNSGNNSENAANNNSNQNNSNSAANNSAQNNNQSANNSQGNSGGRGRNSQTPSIISGFAVQPKNSLCMPGGFIQKCLSEVSQTKLLLKKKAQGICEAEVRYNLETMGQVCQQLNARKITCADARRRDSPLKVVCEEAQREKNCQGLISSNCNCFKNKLNRCRGAAKSPGKFKALLVKSVELECSKQVQLLNETPMATAVENFDESISELVFEDRIAASKKLQRIVEAAKQVSIIRGSFTRKESTEPFFRLRTLLGLQSEAMQQHALGLQEQLKELKVIDAVGFCDKLIGDSRERCIAGANALDAYEDEISEEIRDVERDKGGVVSALAKSINMPGLRQR